MSGYGVWGIWSFPDLELLFQISANPDNFAWYHDENYIITYHGFSFEQGNEIALHIFEIGTDTPVNTLVLTEIPELANIQESLVYSQSNFLHVTSDGKWVILTTRWALLAIPIDYQSE